jgi:hypothetical protein
VLIADDHVLVRRGLSPCSRKLRLKEQQDITRYALKCGLLEP